MTSRSPSATAASRPRTAGRVVGPGDGHAGQARGRRGRGGVRAGPLGDRVGSAEDGDHPIGGGHDGGEALADGGERGEQVEDRDRGEPDDAELEPDRP